MLVMGKGKIMKSVSIELPDDQVVTGRWNYKYLGILGADKSLEEKMKLKVSNKYIRRIRKVLKSKLDGGNLVCGINTYAIPLLRYSAAFVS